MRLESLHLEALDLVRKAGGDESVLAGALSGGVGDRAGLEEADLLADGIALIIQAVIAEDLHVDIPLVEGDELLLKGEILNGISPEAGAEPVG